MEKVVKIVSKILYQILIIVCVLIAAVIILQKVSNSNKSIAGYRIFRVITGSMEPEYDVGEVVISKEVDPKSIKVGDDIVYLGSYGEYSGKIIMHEVVAIDTDENGNLNFHAKGLHSSSVEDPQIKESQIYGVVKFKSGILTVLYKLATNIYSLFVIISILVLNVFISFRVEGRTKVQQLSANNYVQDDGLLRNDNIYDDTENDVDDEQAENDDSDEEQEEYDEGDVSDEDNTEDDTNEDDEEN